MTTNYLEELLDFIKGRGKYSWLGKGIHTYPGREPEQITLHAICVMLEEKGLIERKINEVGHVFWEAKE